MMNKIDKTETASKQYYLGKMNINWADEIDFVFFDVYDENGKKELVSALRKFGSDEITLCFGTNEDSEYSGDDLLSAIEWTKIPDEATKKFLEDNVCGYDNSINHVLESLYDDDEYFEDDNFEDDDNDEEEES